MATSLRHALALLFGALVGSAATYLYLAPSNYAQVSIVNDTGTNLVRVDLTEDRFANRYSVENLSPGSSVTFPVFAWGELGYRIKALTGSGSELSGEFYAEAGYRVTHSISANAIGYDRAVY